ncbi:MAG: amidohydrolase family protein [Rhizobiales bacterium]|nr:amidohydrolase family protein [Hyphomicrobiales bacterium]
MIKKTAATMYHPKKMRVLPVMTGERKSARDQTYAAFLRQTQMAESCRNFPGLKIYHSRSGCFLPYHIGQMDRGFAAHPACGKHLKSAPSSRVSSFVSDTRTHHDQALAFLVDSVGADRIVFGSDYPFEILDPEAPKRLNKTPNLSSAQRGAVLGGTFVAF